MKNKFGHIVLLFGITAMAFGIYRGEVGIVLRRAVVICLECIGIG